MPHRQHNYESCSKHSNQKFQLHAFRYNNVLLFLALLFAGFTIMSVVWHASNKKEADNMVLHLLAVAVCVCIIQIAFVSHAFLDLNNFVYHVLKTPVFQNILQRIGLSVEHFGLLGVSSIKPFPSLSGAINKSALSGLGSAPAVSMSSLSTSPVSSPAMQFDPSTGKLAALSTVPFVTEDVLNQYKLLDSFIGPVKNVYNTYNRTVETSFKRIYDKLSPYISQSANLEGLYQEYLRNPNATNGAALTNNYSSLKSLLDKITPIQNSLVNIMKTIGPVLM